VLRFEADSEENLNYVRNTIESKLRGHL